VGATAPPGMYSRKLRMSELYPLEPVASANAAQVPASLRTGRSPGHLRGVPENASRTRRQFIRRTKRAPPANPDCSVSVRPIAARRAAAIRSGSQRPKVVRGSPARYALSAQATEGCWLPKVHSRLLARRLVFVAMNRVQRRPGRRPPGNRCMLAGVCPSNVVAAHRAGTAGALGNFRGIV
jgi:hypothetical protein